MNGSWFGLIEMLLVFGLVGLWCWNELRVLERDNATAARRDAAEPTGSSDRFDSAAPIDVRDDASGGVAKAAREPPAA